MNAREKKQLETFLRGSDLKTYPQKDQQVLERALDRFRRNEHNIHPVSLGRLIMKSPITRAAAILLLMVGLAVMIWHSPGSTAQSPLTLLTLVNSACAAEQTVFFTSDRIVHVTHQIILFPNTNAPNAAARLDELIESNFSYNKNRDLMKAWFYSFASLPVRSLKPDGQIRWHTLQLAEITDQACLIQEHIWYDPATGFFARVFKQGSQVLFGLSYDGRAVYTAQPMESGRFTVRREPITDQFNLPENPAEFLGISASFQGTMDSMSLPPLREETSEQLADGTSVRIYKLCWDGADVYHIFRVNADDDTIQQIESVAYGNPVQQIQRIASDSVGAPGFSWDLAELAGYSTLPHADVILQQSSTPITARQMTEVAGVETFVFGKTPDWIAEQKFTVLTDQTGQTPGSFVAFCRATDGRHVALIQGETINQYLRSALNMVKTAGFHWTPRLLARNRFKVHDSGNIKNSGLPAEIIFKEAGFEPGEHISGYALSSPTNTCLAMIINGKVTDEELHDLVASLMPASFYLEYGDAVDWYVGLDPDCVTYRGFKPGAFLKEWLVLGSFPVFDNEMTFQEKFADGDAQLDSLDKDPFDINTFEPIINIDGKEYQWELFCSPSEVVDLGWPLGQQDFANAYARAQIEMQEETPVLLAFDADDRAKIWINGELVFKDTWGGHLVPDKALVPVTLRKGLNQILLKVQNGITEWQYTFRIFEADYDPLVDKMQPTLDAVTYDGLKPGEFMKKWLLLGPIPVIEGEPNMAKAEAAFAREHLQSFEQFDPNIRIGDLAVWTPYQSYTGIIDVHRAWPQDWIGEYVVAYAWAQVDMPEETTALLGVGSDDAVKVWLNGQLVLENWTNRPPFPDSDRFRVTFRKGPNQLVIKIQNQVRRWGFCCRLLE